MIELLVPTGPEWTEAVLADFDTFLLDHAACERKASAMAMTFVVRYPDRDAILDPMIHLAREELTHFHRVFKICRSRGLRFTGDGKDPYVNALLKHTHKGREAEFLDRLVMAGVVEERGRERFGCLAEALVEPEMKAFYEEITQSEARHAALFVDLALIYFPEDRVQERLAFFLEKDAEAIVAIPLRPALH